MNEKWTKNTGQSGKFVSPKMWESCLLTCSHFVELPTRDILS